MPASYQQACPAARTLEIVGERWTLLVVRELIGGTKRFVELQRGLPGAAPNLLTERLRRLEEAGVIERIAAGRGHRYGLTEAGWELAPVVAGLFVWGSKHLGAPVQLVHAACATPVTVTISCPCCGPVHRRDCERRLLSDELA